MRVSVSREAAAELEEAAAWYEQEEVGLGERLIDAFEQAIRLLEEPNPPLVPVPHKAAESGAKQLILYRFPFSLITIERNQTFIVVAFAHHSRKPGFWRKRITP
ncbi:type II toxin-antitoxin system RelE/ParE family toxin [Vreelandella subterranea]|uniref:type II toxin-antitoxin system RelE/ParE family toxin n=1 Tax=Vreelandella subterranea TaxID=416874 RepID=UPI002481CD9D|nr:type II toxin-antitoxin system RelE/ParE family toxin [Halomonas subterranea]